ncbi:hypothetical protein BC826DRAFT_997355 [Russula brevipes]|nr:hypothetical protein BC826DRAFT_997341 [Russula brevipes]KAI0298918.1 hypothetical protein BC826DRAFT_997355 [Russula brevipes]
MSMRLGGGGGVMLTRVETGETKRGSAREAEGMADSGWLGGHLLSGGVTGERGERVSDKPRTAG